MEPQSQHDVLSARPVKTNIDRARERLAMKAGVVQRVLATQDGQELMKLLRQQFLYEAEKESPHGAAFRLGQADVVGYLMQMNDFKGEG